MPILSYNCLIKLNLYLMHFFRFQRTWFYLVDQGRPRLGYQAMSTIKGTLKHSRNGRGGGQRKGIQREEKRESSKIQKIYSQSFKSLAREGKEKRDKTRESQGVGIRPISLSLFKISLSLQRNICQNIHISDITLAHKILLT